MNPKISLPELQQFATNDSEETIIRIGASRLIRHRAMNLRDRELRKQAQQLINRLVVEYCGSTWIEPSKLSNRDKMTLGMVR